MYDSLAAALGSSTNWTFESLVYFIAKLINGVIPLTVGLCLLFFFWGLLDVVILSKENAEKLREGRGRIFWSLLAIFVVVSISGILQILLSTLKGQ